jgi:hypothetical protein
MAKKTKKLQTEDKRLEIRLFDDGLIEIKSPHHKKIGIYIRMVDPTDPFPGKAKGALYKINVWNPEEGAIPFEYGLAFIMPDGEVFSRAGSYLEK